MSEVLTAKPISSSTTNHDATELRAQPASTWRAYLPAILPIIGAVILTLWRVEAGTSFISDGALILLTLACYLTAAVFHLTNVYAPSSTAQRLAMALTSLGAFLNLGAWGVRWIAARDREVEMLIAQGRSLSEMPWFFRYIPFANLYDLSIAFAFGAAITTLFIARRKSFRFLGGITLPLASLILILAIFIGNDFLNLPPILDSYWRPIHVGIAAIGYGVALVCFAIGVVYLLKDGVKPEAMGIWSSVFALSVLATVSRFSVFTSATYSASTFYINQGNKLSLPLRIEIPYVGWLLVLSGVLLVGVITTFALYLKNNDERMRGYGQWLLRFALVAQAVSIVTLVTGIKSIKDIAPRASAAELTRFGSWVAEKAAGMEASQVAALAPSQTYRMGADFIRDNNQFLTLSLNANPVELAALISAFTGTMFVLLFSFRTERIRESLPSLERLDGMMYKTASVTFAMLAMLLITGAIWANESWGRYWGWDAKETGAFVAWLTYAGFLHSRITRGWTGRRSAYFALVGFLFILFTYLGVSYLLPGLHSYA